MIKLILNSTNQLINEAADMIRLQEFSETI